MQKNITKANLKNSDGGLPNRRDVGEGGGGRAPPVLDPHLINELITPHGWNIADEA